MIKKQKTTDYSLAYQVGNRAFSRLLVEAGAVFFHRVLAQAQDFGLFLDAEAEEVEHK